MSKKENIHTVFERQQVEKQPSELLENVQNVVAQYMNEIPFEMQKELSNVVHDFLKKRKNNNQVYIDCYNQNISN